MSDMPVRHASFPAPDHAQHDQLLVAQLAGGDALDESRRREAENLVGGCVACAQLAADLQAVARVVAWEPLPPRRRDFRLAPEQAERLSGSPLTRWLRRLSLPRTRALAPAAAGLLSIGLAFVVAGYAWPEGAGSPAADTAPVLREAAPTAGAMAPPEAPAADAGLAAKDRAEQVEAFALEAPAERAVGEDAQQKSLAAAADEAAVDDVAEVGAASGEAAEIDTAAGVPGVAGTVEEQPESALRQEADTAAAATAVTAPSANEGAGTAVGDGVQTAPPAATAGGLDLRAWVILVGLALALLGGVAVAVAWLARRVSDPLLR